MSETLTVEVPSGLFVRIKKLAEQANHSVEDEVLELLAATMPSEDEELIASLELLDNTALERAARSHLLPEFAAELEGFHLKKQRELLTEAETKRAAELLRAYERSMLIRAHSASLLKKRGVDVSHLISQP
jgi:chromosomal replication initiation ATPase DnaA